MFSILRFKRKGSTIYLLCTLYKEVTAKFGTVKILSGWDSLALWKIMKRSSSFPWRSPAKMCWLILETISLTCEIHTSTKFEIHYNISSSITCNWPQIVICFVILVVALEIFGKAMSFSLVSRRMRRVYFKCRVCWIQRRDRISDYHMWYHSAEYWSGSMKIPLPYQKNNYYFWIGRRNFHTYYYRASDNIDVFRKTIKV